MSPARRRRRGVDGPTMRKHHDPRRGRAKVSLTADVGHWAGSAAPSGREDLDVLPATGLRGPSVGVSRQREVVQSATGSRRRRGHPRTRRRRLDGVSRPSRARTTGGWSRADDPWAPGPVGLSTRAGLVRCRPIRVDTCRFGQGLRHVPHRLDRVAPQRSRAGEPSRGESAVRLGETAARVGHQGRRPRGTTWEVTRRGARDATRTRMPGGRARSPDDGVVPNGERPRKEHRCLTSPAAPSSVALPGPCP